MRFWPKGRFLYLVVSMLLVGMLALAAACGDDDDDDDGGDDGAATDAAATGDAAGSELATLSFMSPEDGATLEGTEIEVSVEVNGFEVVDKIGEAPVPGEGHIHYYIDESPPTEPDEPAVTSEGTYHATTEAAHTFTDLEPGEHTVYSQLVDNDHTALDDGPVLSQVSVTLE